MKLQITKFKLLLSLMIVLGTLFTSCNPNDDDTPNNQGNTTGESQINLGATIQRDFMGRIVDQSNLPIENVMVNIGSQMATTDANGMFKINNASVKQRQAYIVAKKAGYFDGLRTMIPNQGTNTVQIMLVPNNVIATVASGTTSEVVLPNGAKVSFDGSFKDDNGNAYTGNVDVKMYYLDPANPDNNIIMPGSLQAVNLGGNERVLETYGMLNVELRGDSGQEINIADGHVAEIEMPVDPAQAGVAPATIPLWHFDEVNGYWVEEGEATLIGGKYVGEVAHFSWWNCDAQFPTVTLCLNVVDAAGDPLSNVKIELWRNGATYGRTGYSNGDGQICGLVPSNEALTLKAFDQCGVEVYNIAIGPFATDTNYGNVVMSTVTATTITGNLIDCSNVNVTNGYVAVNSGSVFSSVDVTNGSFSFNIIECVSSTTFTLEGVDYDAFQTTTLLPFNFSNPNVGNLIACTSVTEYISVQIDNDPVNYYLINLNAGSNGGTSFNISTQTASGNGLIILGGSTTPGTYTTTSTSNFMFEVGINMDFSVPDTLQFTLNNYGAIGEYVDMTITGDFTDTNGVVKSLTATVHVLRDN